MCGICGIFADDIQGRSDPPRESIVRQMMLRIAHRGPDGEGLLTGSTFCLGHRRLAIIDLAGGAQPMSCPDGRYSISFNGEIYNYVELREQLTSRGIRFRTKSDTEVLLQLLVHEGPSALRQLNGMFAFALVNRETGEWLLARDPFGIKPLYYAVVDEELVFGSEIKALLAHPGVKARTNPTGLQQYLTFQFCLNGDTLFQDIHALTPGCYISGRGGSIKRVTRYWDTTYEVDEHHTDLYFEERLRALLRETARLQIRSDVPVGAYLSGGLDSSLVATLMAEQLGSQLPVFHGCFAEGPAYDESAYAKSVTENIQAAYFEAVPTAEQFVEFLPRLIYYLDEPVAGPGLFPQYVVSRMAAEEVKVVLGGQGGDEVFAGYARYLIGYLEQAIKGAIFETQEEGRHIVTLSSIVPNLPLLKQYHPLMQKFWAEGLFDDMDLRYFRLIDRSPDSDALLTKEARGSLERQELFSQFATLFNDPDTLSYVNKMTHFDQKTLLPALLQVEDRVSMAVSLESRVPLLDTRIFDLVTSIPPSMKFKGGETKHILRKVTRDILPESVRKRKDKMGFPVPLKEWMVSGPVRDFVCDTLLCSASRERGIFQPRAVEDLIRNEARFGRQLWGVLCLELWHQRFIDKQDQPLSTPQSADMLSTA